MPTTLAEYEKRIVAFNATDGVTAGQMFGKPCLKIHGKAFVSQHKETIAFKLAGTQHQQAMAFEGAVLWDPSGKGRPMKEWVALPASAAIEFNAFAGAALNYVAEST
ncbi:hypothetical protein [Andreprevotia chitinilytica]|uniref:hypothetical protein n=1 Tax=Andreprevotia chitinilytica TaxID=396808 RepID=UPI00055911DB|nr:hypothetical protein [Andreprevotia chitinilytica]